MDDEDFRRIALSLPGAEEKSHFGKADFRVRNKIFAALPSPGHGVLKLMPDEQSVLTQSEPDIFAPVPGGWGRHGWTEIHLERADEPALRSGLNAAWRNVAPAKARRDLSDRRNTP